MKRTILFPGKYESVVQWMDDTYGKEEFALHVAKLLQTHKSLKDNGIDTFILAELLSKYDIDIYKLIQILENHYEGVPVIKEQKNTDTKVEQKTEIKPEKKQNQGILGLGIDLSS